MDYQVDGGSGGVQSLIISMQRRSPPLAKTLIIDTRGCTEEGLEYEQSIGREWIRGTSVRVILGYHEATNLPLR